MFCLELSNRLASAGANHGGNACFNHYKRLLDVKPYQPALNRTLASVPFAQLGAIKAAAGILDTPDTE
jgi:hypothetical protein